MKNNKILKEYIFKSKISIILIVIPTIISTICTLIVPVLIGNVIELIINLNFKNIIKLIIIIALIYIAIFLLESISVANSSKFSSKVGNNIREILFEKLQKLPIEFIDKNSHGEILTKFSINIENITLAIIVTIPKIITGLVIIIGAIIVMLKLNIILAFTTFFTAPIMYFISRFIVKRTKEMFNKRAILISKINGYTQDIISGIKTVKNFNYNKIVEKKFKKMDRELYKVGKKAQFYASLTNPCTRFINNVTYIIIGVLGIILMQNENLDFASLTSFLIYVNIFSRPFNEITGVITEIQTAIISSNRIKEFLENKNEKDDGRNLIKDIKGNINFVNVSFSYNKDKSFINNMNLNIKMGENIAIVGKTGAGKTSIVNLIMRFNEVDKGEILIDGVNIKDISKDVLRKNIGVVLQDTKLFMGTIKENIAYGKENATDEEIINAAKLSGAHSFISNLKDGYDTVITEKTCISAGEIQLITIARIFLIKPPILILDEATSNVDIIAESKIQKSFMRLMKNTTTFIIAHHLSTIKFVDRIIVLEDGNIVEEGNHEELIRKKSIYYEIYKN